MESSRSALLQRDGDIVDVDGLSPITFDIGAGRYYIVVNHRNHLGIMTSSARTLMTTLTELDLTGSSSLIYGAANAVVEMGSGIVASPGENYDENAQIQNTDLSAIVQLLGAAGYDNADLDMNGQIQNTDINNIMYPNLGKGQQYSNKSEIIQKIALFELMEFCLKNRQNSYYIGTRFHYKMFI